MTRLRAFSWTALAAFSCSLFVAGETGKDPSLLVGDTIIGTIFLLAVSWAIAGMVYLVTRFRARPLALVITSVATSIAISLLALRLLR